ncbi:hypothetical protein BC567DRAFT_15460 [Phyllosticta citribraziliensis]
MNAVLCEPLCVTGPLRHGSRAWSSCVRVSLSDDIGAASTVSIATRMVVGTLFGPLSTVAPSHDHGPVYQGYLRYAADEDNRALNQSSSRETEVVRRTCSTSDVHSRPHRFRNSPLLMPADSRCKRALQPRSLLDLHLCVHGTSHIGVQSVSPRSKLVALCFVSTAA